MHPPLFIDALRCVELRDCAFHFLTEMREWDGPAQALIPVALPLIVPRAVVYAGIKGVCAELIRNRVMNRGQVLELVRPPQHG